MDHTCTLPLFLDIAEPGELLYSSVDEMSYHVTGKYRT